MPVQLDATGWYTPADFLEALRDAIGGPVWHGMSPAAFVDTIFWNDYNQRKPPYQILVVGWEQLSDEVINYIDLMRQVFVRARIDRFERTGFSVDVTLLKSINHPASNCGIAERVSE